MPGLLPGPRATQLPIRIHDFPLMITSPTASWESVLLPENEDGQAWELFHENSKTSRFERGLSDEEVLLRMATLSSSLPYSGYRAFELPPPLPLDAPMGETMKRRATARELQTCKITPEQLTTLLFYSYGETRSIEGAGARSFRVVPSAGALYPLEIYFHSSHIEGWPSGLYHYTPSQNKVQMLREGDHSQQLCQAMVDPKMLNSAIQFFITGLFERSVFKYRERGYRFVLLEAGHLAQNLNLVATALGFGIVNIGGFFDRDVDAFLGLDGLGHSTIYMQVMGIDGAGEIEISPHHHASGLPIDV